MRILLLTSVLLLAGFPHASGASTARSAGPAIAHPTAPTEIVVRVSSGGGFVAPQASLRALPSFTLYGDGTVIAPGAVIQIFPGPAIYPLVRSKLSEPQMQELLKRARRAGLLARGTIDYGNMGAVGVSDAPTTALVVNAGGRHIDRQAYALSINARAGRLSVKQVRARQALARFIATLPRGLAGVRYVPRAIAVYIAPSSGAARPGTGRVVWPLKSDLATAGRPVSSGLGYRCISVRGQDAKALLAT
jgi:hypothetical protein